MPSHAHVDGCARLNIARLNAFRLNVYEPLSFAIINGADRSRNVRIEGAAVEHVLNDAPDTAHVRVHGFVPRAGWPLALYHGDTSTELQLFGGRILETTLLYESRKQNIAYDLQAIDPTWLLNRRRVLAAYFNQSATAIVLDLVTRFTSGITSTAKVVAGLPVIDAITFTNETVATCFTAICERIGAYWYLDYGGALHVYLQEVPDAHPITDADPRGASDFQLSEDLSQVVTRVIGRGAGVGAAVDVAAGATEIPIDLGDQQNFYGTGGGLAEVAAQRITYGGVRGLGGVGAIIGTGNAPTGAPAPSPAGGSSHTVGATYGYAATFTTASGETLPGPLAAITIKTLTMAAPLAPSARSRGAGSYPPGMLSPGGTSIRFMLQIGYVGGAMGPGGAISGPYTWDGNDWELYIGPSAAAGGGYWYPAIEPSFVAPVNWIMVHRSDNGGPWLGAINYLPSSYLGSAPGWWGGNCSGYSSGGTYPLPPTTFGSVIVKSLPVSTAGGVTGRKLYRTSANGAALKLLTTIANNTATEYGDTITDAALGAAPPSLDTSAIKDDGQVLAGAAVLPVSSTTPFAPEIPSDTAGGWVQVGNLIVRYTGIGTGTLTGLPATGPGALTATVRYGAQVLRQPRLVGVTGLTQAIRKGETVTIRIELLDAQAAYDFAVRIQAGSTGEGWVEEVYSDSRMTLTELESYGRALLADRKDPRLTLRFVTRDTSVRVGRLITVNISQPPISGTFRVQRIAFDEIAISGGLARTEPRRTVEASNKLFTFADLLRRLRGREGGAN
jgi:hypothetical protein